MDLQLRAACMNSPLARIEQRMEHVERCSFLSTSLPQAHMLQEVKGRGGHITEAITQTQAGKILVLQCKGEIGMVYQAGENLIQGEPRTSK